MRYKEYNDYELLSFINEADEGANEILFEKYRPLIVSIATKMIKYCKGTSLEINDLIQEGMLGLNIAINRFDNNKEASFYTYSKKCIESKMISLVIASRRLKHKILNDSISIEFSNNDGEIINLENFLSDEKANPEEKLLNEEQESELLDKVKEILTDFEQQVFELRNNGFDYKEISEILDKDTKSIDNALQRIRAKIRKNIKYDQ